MVERVLASGVWKLHRANAGQEGRADATKTDGIQGRPQARWWPANDGMPEARAVPAANMLSHWVVGLQQARVQQPVSWKRSLRPTLQSWPRTCHSAGQPVRWPQRPAASARLVRARHGENSSSRSALRGMSHSAKSRTHRASRPCRSGTNAKRAVTDLAVGPDSSFCIFRGWAEMPPKSNRFAFRAKSPTTSGGVLHAVSVLADRLLGHDKSAAVAT